jgi:hypothetical protein
MAPLGPKFHHEYESFIKKYLFFIHQNLENPGLLLKIYCARFPDFTLFLLILLVAQYVKQKIAEFGWTVLPHPPYSSDLSPTDLFLSMSNNLSGKKFRNVDEVKAAVKNFYDRKSSGFYVQGISKLHARCLKVVECQEDYFE